MPRYKFESRKIIKTDQEEHVVNLLSKHLMHKHRLSEHYRAQVLKSVRYFIRHYGVLKPSVELAGRVEADLRSKNASIRTITLYLYYLEYWAESLGVDLKLAKPHRVVRRMDYLSVDEVRKLLEACDNIRDHAIIAVLLYCGLRNHELVSLDLEDVDFKRHMITVRSCEGNKSNGIVYMVEYCENALKTWIDGRPIVASPALFISDRGERLTSDGLRLLVARLGRRAEINRRVYPHLLRATMATHMSMNGIGIDLIQRQLRQRDMRSTLIYMRAGERELQEAMKTKFKY